MPDHPEHDLLSRYLRRRQIGQECYEHGRRLQGLYQSAERGDARAAEIIDGIRLSWKWRENLKRHELLRDVLGLEEVHGLPTPLAQAAAKRGLNPTTSSRDMKRLGAEVRESLHALAGSFAPPPALPYSTAPSQGCQTKHQLGGVEISTSEVNDLEPEQKLRSLANARQVRVFESGIDAETEQPLFTVLTPQDDIPTYVHGATRVELYNVPLEVLTAVLERVDKFRPDDPVRRKRGARGAGPVTLAKHA